MRVLILPPSKIFPSSQNLINATFFFTFSVKSENLMLWVLDLLLIDNFLDNIFNLSTSGYVTHERQSHKIARRRHYSPPVNARQKRSYVK